jgi:hypothetical protein
MVFFGRVLHVRNDNVDAPQIVAELREYGMPRVSAIGDIDVNRLRRIGAQTAATPTAYWQAEGRVVSILNEHFVYVEKVPRFGGGAGVATRGEKSFEWLTEKQFQAKFKEAPKLAVLSPEAPQEVLDGTLAIGEKHLIRRSFADVWLRSEGRATCSEPCFAPFVPQSLSNLLDATGDAARPRAPAAPAGKLNTYCDFAVSYDSVAYLHTDDGSWLRPALPLLFHVYHVFAGGVWEHFVELLGARCAHAAAAVREVQQTLVAAECARRRSRSHIVGRLLARNCRRALVSHKTADFEHDVFDRMSGVLDGKLLVVADEMGSIAKAHEDPLKALLSVRTMPRSNLRRQSSGYIVDVDVELFQPRQATNLNSWCWCWRSPKRPGHF